VGVITSCQQASSCTVGRTCTLSSQQAAGPCWAPDALSRAPTQRPNFGSLHTPVGVVAAVSLVAGCCAAIRVASPALSVQDARGSPRAQAQARCSAGNAVGPGKSLSGLDRTCCACTRLPGSPADTSLTGRSLLPPAHLATAPQQLGWCGLSCWQPLCTSGPSPLHCLGPRGPARRCTGYAVSKTTTQRVNNNALDCCVARTLL
jgi:hypothetical protein